MMLDFGRYYSCKDKLAVFVFSFAKGDASMTAQVDRFENLMSVETRLLSDREPVQATNEFYIPKLIGRGCVCLPWFFAGENYR